MAAQNLVLLTRSDDGKQFKISTTKIIYFQVQGSETYLKYVTQRGISTDILVNESVAAINALTGGRTQDVTLYNGGTVRAINSDRIIYIHSQTWGSRITYDISGDRGKYNLPPIHLDVLESGATINTAAGNTGIINPQGGKQYWINGDLADLVSKDPSNPADFILLYDSRKTEFEKLKLSSANSYLSVGSGWI